MYLPCETAPDAKVVYGDGAYVIRTEDGRYLLQGDYMGFPVPRELETEKLP